MDAGGILRKVAITGGGPNGRQPSTSGPDMKHETKEVVVTVFSVSQAETLMFKEPTKEAYKVLQEAMQPYC